MSKKEEFLILVEKMITYTKENSVFEVSVGAEEYFEIMKASDLAAGKPKFTENGKKVLKYMQEQKDNSHNIFKAKDIGEGLFISSRAASGALRKLVTDGYAEKVGSEPVVYSLTELGVSADTESEGK